MHRSIWHDEQNNQLKWWDQPAHKWRRYYENEFKITESITSILPPDDPVQGQLWIHNGVLCYFDGTAWQPIKALLQDGSQFSLDVFKNYILISPLWKIGNTVVDDLDIEAFKEEERKYLQGKLDAHTDSDVTGDGTKYEIDVHQCLQEPPQLPTLPNDSKAQLLIPNLDTARIFLNHELDTEKYEEVSKVCIQYKRNDLLNAVPSLIHINPGRLTQITKRIVKIDRNNPRIQISAANTEFYGFHKDSYLGDFLLPDQEKQTDDGSYAVQAEDYTIVEDGILLSYNASQNYDFVLAITYEFSWMKSTGKLDTSSTQDATNAYYVDKFSGPFNIFVDGYNYEDPYYSTDGISQTITTKEDTSSYDVTLIHVPKREYGYIRQIDINGRGIIRTLRDYKNPLVFVNGEAMSELNGDVTLDPNGLIYVQNAKQDMAWCVIDLHEEPNDRNNYTAYDAQLLNGTVGQDNLINYSSKNIDSDESVVLFVDGLLVKKEDLIFDRANKKLNVAGGLAAGQTFTLVEDKYNWLYDETALQPALSVGKFSESLVYFNRHLICNSTAIDTLDDPYTVRINPDSSTTNVPYEGVFNEVKNFKVVYDEVQELPNMQALEQLIQQNRGKRTSDLEKEIDKAYRQQHADDIASGRITEDAAALAISKEQRKRIVRDGVLYYIADTKNGYVGKKDDNANGYPCSYEPAFLANDKTTIRDFHRDNAGTLVQVTNNAYRIYDNVQELWAPMTEADIKGVQFFSYSYENMPRSIRLLLPYTKEDVIRTYAFNMANAIEHPLAINSVDVQESDTVQVSGQYLYGANTLRVWCNGVRQYPNTAPEGEPLNGIQESIDGKSFKLPEVFTGKVTYVIELPENNQSQACSMEVLGEGNILSGYINMYHTTQPMFPGRVTVYVNGIRQPADAFTVFDNYTLLINGDTPLIGSTTNFPTERTLVGDKIYERHHSVADKILVEVRQDDRQEKTIKLSGHPTYEISVDKYNLPIDILEASDEIMIFADGLYYGGTLNGDKLNGGYTKNPARGCITINQEEILDAINQDEEYLLLTASPTENIRYLKNHENQPYERYNATLTFEWR